ncbi:MAG TPA: glycosyltransferase family 39 protein [Vicinamibacterales bacterium]|nr:glycosyltransferase family 39 protein [Vicinamibacterales bacterium]
MLTRSGTVPPVALDRSLALPVSRARLAPALVLVAALVAGSPGLFDESAVSLHGDSAKHLMNGVFLADALRDWPAGGVGGFLEYARHYYAQYPALSLGHHPPLVAVAEAPMFLVFGVSVTAARTVQLVSFVAAALLLYLLVRDHYGITSGVLASAIFITSPTVVMLGRSIMSEMPAVALVLAGAVALQRYVAGGRRGALVVFVLAAAGSLYAKQLAVFVFPAYVAIVAGSLGVRRLAGRDLVLAAVALAVLILPLAWMTLAMSPANVRAAVTVLTDRSDASGPWLSVWRALKGQFTWPMLVLIGLGAARALTLARQGGLVFGVWAVAGLAGLAAVGPWEPARYGVYAVPGLAALAASLAHGWRRWPPAVATAALLVAAIGHQATVAAGRPLAGAGGYEDAARFVTASNPGPTVLFSGDIDTGYFTFFVRKHDPDRALVVLRADKILTTSYMGNPGYRDRITDRSAIYHHLREYGVRFVVIEDTAGQSPVLEWLRQELRSDRFQERRRIPIVTTDARLRGTDLAVYEYLEATPPAADAVLSIDLPIVGRSVTVKLSDLTGRKGRQP